MGRSDNELDEHAVKPSVKTIATIRTKSSFVPKYALLGFRMEQWNSEGDLF